MAAGPRLADLGTWRSTHTLAVPVAIALASRLFSIAVLGVEGVLAGTTPDKALSTWDGSWYLRIAGDGYHAQAIQNGVHDYAFFPAWPIAIRIVSLGSVPTGLTAVVLANVLSVAGLVLVWKVLAARLDASTATGATLLFAFAPPSYVLSMAYAEPLMIVTVAGSLLATRPWVKGLLAGIASATRLSGIALGAAAAQATVLRHRVARPLVIVVIGSAIGFLLWFGYVAYLTGDLLGFFGGSTSWIHGSVLHHQKVLMLRYPLRFALWFGFVALVAVGGLLLIRRDHELGAYALGIVVLAVASIAAIPAASVARYALPAFPAYAGLASRLGRRWTVGLAIAFATGQIVFASWTFGPGRTPP